MYIQIHLHIVIHTYICIYMYIYMYRCICIYMCTYKYIYICMSICIYIYIYYHTHTHTNSLSLSLFVFLSRSLSLTHTHRHSIATKRLRKRSITQDLCKFFFPPVCYIRDKHCADTESFRQVLWANTKQICWFCFSLCSPLSPRDSKIINMSNAGRLQRGHILRYVEILM